MPLLENKGIEGAANEVSNKFIPTYKVAVCVWPLLQTINFTFISEKNRVPFVSICSLIWTTFLSFMNQRKDKSSKDESTL
ncbi:hypothetical protein J437_LFUL002784 [Ladona fulva]|uniref:Mpv17-like protein n=1 Tax=Ladona fulva TaxID=123851 RepID=A0A8K0JT79_LADFU|nr:hypothetical protein J437_LFUL002784 [Ladona fulva]